MIPFLEVECEWGAQSDRYFRGVRKQTQHSLSRK